MATTLNAAICPYRSETASQVPLAANMEVGELAVNLTDQKIYAKTAAGAVVQVGGVPASGGSLPSYGGNDGKYLSLSGGALVWSAVTIPTIDESLPSQAGNADKVLETNGSAASWQERLPSQTSKTGYYLRSGGANHTEYWHDLDIFAAAATLDEDNTAVTLPATPLTTTRTYSTNGVWLDAQYDIVLSWSNLNALGLFAVVYDKTNGTFGTSVVVRATASGNVNTYRALRISATQVLVVSVPPNLTSMEAVILDISGTTITVGTAATLTVATAGVSNFIDCLPLGSSYVLAYRGTGYVRAVAMTVSGSTVSFGAETSLTLAGTSTGPTFMCSYDDTHMVFGYTNSGTTITYFDTMTVSGTTLTLGTGTTQATTSSDWVTGQAVGTSYITCTYRSGTVYLGVITVSANVITMNVVNTALSGWPTHQAFEAGNSVIVVAHNTTSDSYARLCTISAGVPTATGSGVTTLKFDGTGGFDYGCIVARDITNKKVWVLCGTLVAGQLAGAFELQDQSGTLAITNAAVAIRDGEPGTIYGSQTSSQYYYATADKSAPWFLKGSRGTFIIAFDSGGTGTANTWRYNGTSLRSVKNISQFLSAAYHPSHQAYNRDTGTENHEVFWHVALDSNGMAAGYFTRIVAE